MNSPTASERIALWRRDPVQFVRDNFSVEPDQWQAEALRAFADPGKQRIALQACAGPGKSAVLAWFGWNFLACYATKDEHPNAAAISITGDNLKDNLWKELAVWHGRSDFLRAAFEWTQTRIFAKQFPQTWFMSARSWSKTANAEEQGRTLSGLHSPFILYLADESGDIPRPVLRSAEQGLSNCRWGKIAQAGNPTSHEGMLYQSVKEQSHLWHVIRITGDPDDPRRSPRIDIEWARQQIAMHGRDNPWVMAYILGKFPPTGINTLLGPDDIHAAMQRGVRESDIEFVQKRLGIDVARFGDDRTVIFPRQGLLASKPTEMRNARTTDIAARVAMIKTTWGSEVEMIDDTGGWAAGVVDQCLLGGISLLPVNFSGSPLDPRYFNRRSELHFLAAEWVKRGGCLPADVPELVREATAPTYWYEAGKLRVEEKAQVKSRLGASPDYWDALICTFALPDMPAQIANMAAFSALGGMASEYDPLDGRSR